jgi:hypothetical protein
MSLLETAQFRATSGSEQAFGVTPEEAVHELMAKIKDVDRPIIIWPYNRGDAFFSDAQQARLRELRDRLESLSKEERQELEQLVEASFDATIARTQAPPFVKS